MSNKVYVGNLPFEMKESELEILFREAGEVKSIRIITDQHTGRGKGFGFVEMNSSDEANEAIEKFNGSEVMGRTLRVDLAKENRGGRRPSPGGNSLGFNNKGKRW